MKRNATYDDLDRLQSSWIRHLRWHYDVYNQQYLGSQLCPPIFLIGSSREKLGEWSSSRRSITISKHHILMHRWEDVCDTLRHEMAHQYVDEVLRLTHAPPHGEPFLRACRLLRCDPEPGAGTGRLGRLDRSSSERDKILQRVKELFALAGSPNEHEAANAMRMAHKYLLKYNLDISQLDAKHSYGSRFLGRCSRRIQEYQYILSSILQDHFFVMGIWTFFYDPIADRSGRILQIVGTPENLEMAEYAHDYVMNLVESLWKERRRQADGRGRGTKLQYLAGLLHGFQEKLEQQGRQLEKEHGLVWLGDPELRKYYEYLHPRTRSISTSGVSRGLGYRDGVRDGHQISIRRGIHHDSGYRGRLLSGPGG